MPLSTHKLFTAALLPAAVVAGLFLTAGAAAANVAVTQVSSDPFTDAQAQHRTEVEPDTFAFGSTIVSAFQVGRVSGGGASNVGFATSTNGGATWTQGFLPGTTGNSGGPCGQLSDAAVAFDARHNVWLISTLGVNGTSWSAATHVAGPMTLSWIPNTSQGRMFGDYISTSVRSGGNAFPVIPIASAPSGSTFSLGMFAPTGGLPITGGAIRSSSTVAADAAVSELRAGAATAF